MKALKIIRADLHLHTCLSPCGGYDVSPAAVVARAAEQGLGLIAVCDHNTAENISAVRLAAGRLGPKAPHVLAGLEITTGEEAHLLALFENLADALTMQAMVYSHLQEGHNRPEVFGEQIVANAEDEVEEFNRRLLIGATDLSVEQTIRRIHGLGGLALAAHIDRPAYSLLGQLGLLTPELGLDGVEVSRRYDPAQAAELLAGCPLPVLTGSDAHDLESIGAVWSELRLAEPSLAELALALRDQDGRAIAGWGRRGSLDA